MNVASDHECGSDDTVSIDALGRRYTVKPGPKPSGCVGPRVTVRLSVREWEFAKVLASEDETTLADILREGLQALANRRS
jgi:hypothetical protein